MKTKNLNEMSKDVLLKYKKTLESVPYIFAAALLMVFYITIFQFLKNGFTALSVIPIALLPLLIMNFSTLQEIKKETNNQNLS